MADVKFDDIRLFLSDPRVQVRSSLRMALNDAGLRNANIWEGGDLEAISVAVTDPNGPDILICDVTENTDLACEMFNNIRHGEIGLNPFVCIIAVAWSPKQPMVNKVVDSGADLLVAAPISPTVILDRIDSLVHNRKPFVVTNDYIGPDRRFLEERESGVEQIDVPNTLRDRALGQFNAAKAREEIDAMCETIDSQKIDRHAFQVAYLADLICECYQNQNLDGVVKQLKDLNKVTKALYTKADEMGAKEIEQLCIPLKSVVNSLMKSRGRFSKKDIDLLAQLSMAFRASLKPEVKGTSLIEDISKMVTAGARG
jgi:response regulator RpfG family c-di-GMP phosphodiesterase